MSKFSFSNSNIENTVGILSTVSTKDTVTEITFGTKDLGDKVEVVFNTTSVGEQIAMKVAAKKPEGFDGTPITIGVKSTVFQAVIASLTKFGEDVYIDISDKAVKAGVVGKAEVGLDTVAELPQKLEGGEVMLQFALKTAELNSLVKRGLSTGSQEIRDDGTHNAVLSIDVSDGEGRGAVVGFSTTRHLTSLAKGKVLLPVPQEGNDAAKAQYEATQAVLNAYVEKTGQKKEAFTLVLPVQAVRHLSALANNVELVPFFVTEKYIQVMLGTVGTYTFRQNAKAPASAEALETIIAQDTDGGVSIGFDAATLLNGVGFINDMDKLDGTLGRKAVKLTASADGLLMISGNGDKAKTSVKATAGGGAAECYINGALLRDAIGVLDKGNIVLTFGNSTVMVENGTPDAKSGNGFAFIMKAQADDTAEEADESEDASEESGEGADS